MTGFADVVARRGEGAFVYAIQVEGLPELWTSHPTVPFDTTGMPTGLTQIRGALRTEGIKWGHVSDPKTGDLKMVDNVFRLVDVEDANGTIHKVTDLLRGIEGVIATEGRETLSAADVVAYDVEDTAAFPASGDIYVDLETMEHDAKTGAPASFDTLTRAKYGSRAVPHVYDGTDDGDRAEGPLIPFVTDRPISWYGRRVTLWIAELRYSSTAGAFITSAPDEKYVGRILDNYGLEGMEWTIPTEPVWTIIDAQIPSDMAQAALRGINFDGPMTIDWEITSGAGAGSSGTAELGVDGISITPAFTTMDQFFWSVEEAINASIRAAGPLHFEQVRVNEKGGLAEIVRSHDVHNLLLTFNNFAMRWIFGGRQLAVTRGPTPEPNGFGPPGIGLATGLLYYQDPFAPFEIKVSNTGVFSQFVVEPAEGGELRSVIRIADAVLYLDSIVDATTIRVHAFRAGEVLGPREVGPGIYSGPNEAPFTVTEGLYMQGDFAVLWEAFVQSTTIPATFRSYLHDDDFDWDEIKAARVGEASRRKRILFTPRSFRDLLKEDLIWAGCYPTITAGATKVSARPMQSPNEADVQLVVDGSVLIRNELPTFRRGTGRSITLLEFRGGFSWEDEKFTEDQPLTIAQRSAQQAYGIPAHKKEIKNSGIEDFDPMEWRETMQPIANAYFNLFARDNPFISRTRCNVAAANLVAGDTIELTHWWIPDMGIGSRGITGELCLVLGNEITLVKGRVQCTLTLLWLAGARHSGYAPCALVTGHTLIPPSDLTLATGQFATVQNEGLYFTVGDKVRVQQIDDFTPIADETFEVASINADGTVMGLDGNLSAPMIALITGSPATTDVWIIHDDYDTAGATDGQQKWVHVADDADRLIGTSGDPGFRPG